MTTNEAVGGDITNGGQAQGEEPQPATSTPQPVQVLTCYMMALRLCHVGCLIHVACNATSKVLCIDKCES